jgi:PAS domain S-box-containing protein
MTTEQSNHDTKSANAQTSTDIGSWCLDMVNNRLYWSAETYRIFGIPEDEFLPYYGTFYNTIHPDDLPAWTTHRDLFLKGSIPMNFEHRIIQPNGEIRNVHELGKRIFDKNNRLIWLSGTVQDITDRRAMSEELENSPLVAKQGSDRMDGESKVVSLLDKPVFLFSSAIAKIRNLSKGQPAPDMADLSLYSAVESLVDQITAAKSITVLFDTEMFYEDGLSQKIKLNILRVIQEQFNTIVKHAYVSEIYVSLHRSPQKIFLTIQDNGQGFDIHQKKNATSIINMFNRAEINNVKVAIQYSEWNGCRLDAEFTIKLPKKGLGNAAF